MNIDIEYRDDVDDLTPDQFIGFFEGWPSPPSPATHVEILKRSTHVVLAVNRKTGKVVGFINALSDDILTAYIPLLEVLPQYRHHKIGTELVQRLLAKLKGLYMIDLLCDPSVQPFYEELGLVQGHGMCVRDFDAQCGRVGPKRPQPERHKR